MVNIPSPAPWRFTDVLLLFAGLAIAAALTRGAAAGLSSWLPSDPVPPPVQVSDTSPLPETPPVLLLPTVVAPEIAPVDPPVEIPAEANPPAVPERRDRPASAAPPSAPTPARADTAAVPPVVEPPTPATPPPASPPAPLPTSPPAQAPAALPAPVPDKPIAVVDPDIVWIASSGDKVYHQRRDCPALMGMFKRASLKTLVGHASCPVCVR